MKYFQNQTHRDNVMTFLRKENHIFKDGEIDCYYLPAIYLLLSTNNSLYKKTRQYISSDGIDFETMIKKQDFSGGEFKIVQLAANLFNGSMEVSSVDFVSTLDEDNFDLAINSIYFRRYGCNVKTLFEEQNSIENEYELEL